MKKSDLVIDEVYENSDHDLNPILKNSDMNLDAVFENSDPDMDPCSKHSDNLDSDSAVDELVLLPGLLKN